MLPADELDRLPVDGLDAGNLSFRKRSAVLTDSSGEPVGVFVPLEHYRHFRELLKADDYPEGVLEPIPLDEKGRPLGITGEELIADLTRLADRLTAERDAPQTP